MCRSALLSGVAVVYAVPLALLNLHPWHQALRRRDLLATLGALPFVGPLSAMQAPKRQYYELRVFQMRNGTQPQRANEFFSKHFGAAAKRAGLGPVGFFNPVFGENSPYLMALITYPAFGDAEHLFEKLMADSDFASALRQWHKPMDPGYTRYESTLLRAFEGHPQLTMPPHSDSGHIFELRTYESNDSLSLRKKIEMFNGGEMQIFQRLGMNPVFFGEAMIGAKLPHLTYMLAYDDMAARERVWKAFSSDPEWQKLRSKPGYADAEIVSNISNTILRPTAYSDIK